MFQLNLVHAQIFTDTLSEAVISGKFIRDTIADDIRVGYSSAYSVQTFDKKYLRLFATQSLASLIGNQSSVFVKSYGINSLATLSFRGASAAQSAVYWEGVPVQNPALGMADIALLQTGVFSKISLQYGSSSALYGSGNVGGALLLAQDVPTFEQGKNLSLTLSGGSFNRKAGVLQSQFENNKWRIAVNLFYQNAENNFPYTDFNNNEYRMQNAMLNALGGLAALDHNLSKRKEVKESVFLKIWWQDYKRHIPPALFEQQSVKYQHDRAARLLGGWHRESRQNYFYSKTAYSNELLYFRDQAVSVDNHSLFHTIYHETGWQHTLQQGIGLSRSKNIFSGYHYFLVFTPVQYSFAENSAAHDNAYQFRPAVAVAYKFKDITGRLYANVMLRQEWVNGDAAPLLPGAGVAYLLFKQKNLIPSLTIKGNLQKTYRIPTINELYAFVGGNTALKPEQGWNSDGGYISEWLLQKQDSKKALSLKHELNLFSRNIKDWIYWMGGAIWTPHNIAEVHSRGLETVNKAIWQLNKDIAFHLDVNYTYVLSTTVASYIPGDGSIGKQIPYTPRYNVQSNIGMTIFDLWFNYNHTYTGYRFTTTDESQYLLPFSISNVQLSYSFPLAGTELNITAQVANLFDLPYQVVNARPMPGRNYILSCSVNLGR